MSELQVIQSTLKLNTKDTLIQDLKDAGLKEGMTVIVHTSLKSIGWINGGAIALIQALMEVLTEQGTLVMPAHSGNLSDPADWCNPPVPKEWIEEIRRTMPAYDSRFTPTNGIGTVPEIFRTFPNVLRSNHPQLSFTAWGKHAKYITEQHELRFALGKKSPLQRIYDLDGYVLMIGTTYETNTSFHLAEYQTKRRKIVTQYAPCIINNERVWKDYFEVDLDNELFEEIGENFEKEHTVHTSLVGMSKTKLIPQRLLVDYAINYLNTKHNKKQIEDTTIRFATKEDALGIAKVHAYSWQVAYEGLISDEFLNTRTVERSLQKNIKLFRDINEFLLVMEKDNEIIGFLWIDSSRDEDATNQIGEIQSFYILPEYQYYGYGSTLIKKGLQILKERNFKEVTLWVLEDNTNAIHFYEKHGFVFDQQRKQLDIGEEVFELRYRLQLQ